MPDKTWEDAAKEYLENQFQPQFYEKITKDFNILVMVSCFGEMMYYKGKGEAEASVYSDGYSDGYDNGYNECQKNERGEGI